MPIVPQITQVTKEKAESAKAYIEKKYQKLKHEEKERKEGKTLAFDDLVAWDMLSKKMQKLNLSESEQELIKQDILHKEAELNRKM